MNKKIHIPNVTGNVKITIKSKSTNSTVEKIPCTKVEIINKMLTSSSILDKQQIEVKVNN